MCKDQGRDRKETGEGDKRLQYLDQPISQSSALLPGGRAGEGGSERQGEEAERKAQGQERGETHENHLSLMPWTISRSRGERSEDQKPAGEDQRKTKARASSILERVRVTGRPWLAAAGGYRAGAN